MPDPAHLATPGPVGFDEAQALPPSLATLAPTRGQLIAARVAVIGLALLFLAVLPHLQRQLPALRLLVLPYQTALALFAWVTAWLLLAQARMLRSTPLLVLSASYWFSGGMALAHALSFPGLGAYPELSPGAGQVTAWLYFLWHTGFALGIAAYSAWPATRVRQARLPVAWTAAAANALLLGCVALALLGARWLPALMQGDSDRPAKLLVALFTLGAGLLSLGLLWRRGARTVLDLWLRVAMLAWVCAVLLAGVLNHGRFDLGWYAGRLCTLLADATVLLALLLETSLLYARLADAYGREQEQSRRRLQASETRFEATFERAAVGMALVSPQGSWLRVNPELCRITGYAADELLGQDPLRILHPDDAVHSLQTRQRMLAGNLSTSSAERRLLRKDGHEVWVQSTVALVWSAPGVPGYFVTVIEDIQSRKDAEAALRESEQRFRAVFDHATVGISIHDAQSGALLSANAHALRHCGEAAGPGDAGPDAAPRAFACADAVDVIRAAARQEQRLEWRSVAPDGTEYWEDVLLTPVQLGGARRVLAVASDVTARKELQRQILEVSTTEQESIGREIHDGLGQQLTALSLFSSGLERRLRQAGQPVLADEAARLQHHLEVTLAQTRALARGLAPVDIDRHGLPDALRALAEQVQATTRIDCRYHGLDALDLGEAATAVHLFRIAQEGLNNAVRHAGASSIELRLRSRHGELLLQVLDDGRGIEPAASRQGRLGLHTMAYRAGVLGARLQVRRRRAGGTELRCQMPLPAPGAA